MSMSKELVPLSPQRSSAGTEVLQKLKADSEGQLGFLGQWRVGGWGVKVCFWVEAGTKQVEKRTHASMMSTVMQLPTPPTLAPP